MMDRDRELHEMADEGRALMTDYIKREDAIKAVHEEWDECINYDGSGEQIASETEDALYALDAEDVAPVRHGRWIELAMKGEYKCSVCGRGSKSENTFQLIPTVYWNYCPNCGARMDGENDEID